MRIIDQFEHQDEHYGQQHRIRHLRKPHEGEQRHARYEHNEHTQRDHGRV